MDWLGNYQPGRPYAKCDRCDRRYRIDQLRTEWSNARVCDGCFDPRPVHLSTPYLRPGEGAPLPGARPDTIQQIDTMLWSDGTDVFWSDVDRLYDDQVCWSDT